MKEIKLNGVWRAKVESRLGYVTLRLQAGNDDDPQMAGTTVKLDAEQVVALRDALTVALERGA